MPKPDKVLKKMREICLALPDTKETLTWGQPHFRVGEKIFAGCGDANGKRDLDFKLEMEHAMEIVQTDSRFERAPYVGHKGWVSMDADHIDDWDEVRALMFESYRLIAPKKSLAKLETTANASAKQAAKRAPARKSR